MYGVCVCVCVTDTGQLEEMVWDGTEEELEWIGIALASGKGVVEILNHRVSS